MDAIYMSFDLVSPCSCFIRSRILLALDSETSELFLVAAERVPESNGGLVSLPRFVPRNALMEGSRGFLISDLCPHYGFDDSLLRKTRNRLSLLPSSPSTRCVTFAISNFESKYHPVKRTFQNIV
jgi:hypothetical protein